MDEAEEKAIMAEMYPVRLSNRRYKELLDAEKELARLEANGVDNWEGY
jgi:hypothetical protein